jgi:hypothetical protein
MQVLVAQQAVDGVPGEGAMCATALSGQLQRGTILVPLAQVVPDLADRGLQQGATVCRPDVSVI